MAVVPFGGGFADLGGQVLLWELATALVGALLGIQPFDQPDVAAAKAATAAVLDEGPPAIEATPLDDLLARVGPGDYLAIQAFVDPGQPRGGRHRAGPGGAARPAARWRPRSGLGPRFLHSTGQLHKGGPDTGVFVQVVGDDPDDVPIPGAGYGFSALKHAQADGDLVTLQERGRRAGGCARRAGGGGAVKVGMVGLGRMGGNMAARLAAAGHEVVGYDAFSDGVAGGVAGRAGGRLDAPRVVWVMVPAGEPTERWSAELGGLLEPATS